MRYFGAGLIAIASLLCASTGWSAVVLSNTPTGGSVSSFGSPDSQTYGQVFTAPVTGTLDSFTLYLDGGVGGNLHGAVGTWNGTAAHGYGFGESSNLFTSGSVSAVAGGAYTFTPGIAVTAGTRYVAYLSVFGESALGTTSMPLGTNVANIDYFVWNNTSDPQNNPSWNYFFNTGDVLFEAVFTERNGQVPEPASLAVLGGLVCLGAIGRRFSRRRA